MADPDGFDLDGFDEAYDISDFGTEAGEQAFTTDEMAGGSPDISFGGDNEEGFSSFVTNLTPQQAYTMGRGAKSRALGDNVNNPFPESIFSRIFGAENVDYTNIIGGDRTGEINELRFRQAMGLPSLRTGQPFQMGDFYIGQPTLEGTVKEVPRGGIIGLIPGVSTIANILGRNRGLPEGSEAYRKAMAEANKPVFQPLTDIVNNMTSGIGAFIDRFRSEGGDRDTVTDRPIQPRGKELGDMDTSTAFIPESRVVVDDFNRPLSRAVAPKFISDMNQTSMLNTDMLNTGITQMRPNIANQANMEVADALQLIQPGTLADSIGVRNFVAQRLNPELKAFIDSQPPIEQRMRQLEDERKERERNEQFRKEVLTAIQNSSRNQPRYVAQDPFKPFDNSGPFINLDNI